MVQETRKVHPRNIKMIKDDQGGIRNPYKCKNIMKQDVVDDKIIKRMQNMWKTNLSTRKNVKHIDPKTHTHTHTHTHTLNKSNQFYISKISEDNLVSIH